MALMWRTDRIDRIARIDRIDRIASNFGLMAL